MILFLSFDFTGVMWFQYMIGPNMLNGPCRCNISNGRTILNYLRWWKIWPPGHIPMPRICIAPTSVPNAFAFGRSVNDGRVCVCQGILNLLTDEELKAVLGHELTHLKNHDVITITLLSVVPMILYRIAWQMMWFGGGRRR